MKLTFLLTFITFLSFGQKEYHFSKKIMLSGDGKWDYMQLDENKNRLFVTHQNKVHVLDLKSDSEIKSFDNLNGVHGVALAVKHNKGYISNGTDNVITIFDYTTLDVLKTIKIEGKKADAIMYDAYSDRVFVFNNGSGDAVAINPKDDSIIGVLELGGAPEFTVSNQRGLLYNNNEDTQEITVMDSKTLAVTKHFSVLPSEVPTGLAFDLENNRLFSVCRKDQNLVILDAKDGHIVQRLSIGAGTDAARFDSKRKLVFAANGEGNLNVFKQIDADHYEQIQDLKTVSGAKTMEFDSKTNRIFVSAAEFIEGTKNLKQGTFGVYVYTAD